MKIKRETLIALLIIFSVSLSHFTIAQRTEEEKYQRKEMKKLKKKQKKEELRRAMEISNELLERRYWVLEIQSMRSNRGSALNVNPQSNYVLVNGDEVVMQFSEGIDWDSQFMGVTRPSFLSAGRREGKIQQYNIKQSKKQNNGNSLQTILQGGGFSATAMLVFVKPDGGQISFASGSERVIINGILMDPEKSNIVNLTPNTMFKSN